MSKVECPRIFLEFRSLKLIDSCRGITKEWFNIVSTFDFVRKSCNLEMKSSYFFTFWKEDMKKWQQNLNGGNLPRTVNVQYLSLRFNTFTTFQESGDPSQYLRIGGLFKEHYACASQIFAFGILLLWEVIQEVINVVLVRRSFQAKILYNG